MPIPAVFLDRDGTLIEDVGYLDRLERLRFYPWSLEAIRLLRRAGYAVVIVTNQAGVSRGFVREPFVEETFQFIQGRLAAVGESLDGHYYCPHEPNAPLAAYRRECDCRKPRPGMIRQAATDLNLDVARSVVVGDKWSDIALARATGATAVLVRTGYGATQAMMPPAGLKADLVASNLIEAVGWALRELPRPVRR